MWEQILLPQFFSQKFREINFLLKNFTLNWFDEKKCMAMNFSFFHHTVLHSQYTYVGNYKIFLPRFSYKNSVKLTFDKRTLLHIYLNRFDEKNCLFFYTVILQMWKIQQSILAIIYQKFRESNAFIMLRKLMPKNQFHVISLGESKFPVFSTLCRAPCNAQFLISYRFSVEIAEILSLFFRKNFVKAIVLPKKLLNSRFNKIFFSDREFLVFTHCVVGNIYKTISF